MGGGLGGREKKQRCEGMINVNGYGTKVKGRQWVVCHLNKKWSIKGFFTWIEYFVFVVFRKKATWENH